VPSAIWTGTISFGLVTVPVRVVSATRSLDVRFNQLDPETGARIRYRRVSEATGEEVPTDKIARGYEVSPGQYVIVEAEEMESLRPKATRQIEIEDFVDLADIDPVYFEQPYYLVPDKDAAKPYRLLLEAMRDLGKVAIGRFVLRSKETLVAIRPVDGALCLETMRYADEVLAPDREVPLTEATTEPSTRELEMARQLVSALAGEFEPTKYRDEYREELLGLIQRKAQGETIVTAPAPEEPGRVLDLMAALEASLARAGSRSKARSSPADGAEADGAEAPGEGAKPKPAARGARARPRTAAAAKKTPSRARPRKSA
jgi:DNA end-binding protein Ku